MAAQDYFVGPAQERFQQRQGTTFSVDGTREYQRHFLVQTRDKELGPLAVCYCPGLPVPWSVYITPDGKEYDLLALATRYEAKQLDEGDEYFWIVTVTYSTDIPPGGVPEFVGTPVGPGGAGRRQQRGSQNNPELEPPEVDWDEEVRQKPIRQDLDGKFLKNSAGQPYNHTQEDAYNILTITRNDLWYDPKTAVEFAFAVNSDEFLGWPPGSAQCMPFKAKLMHRGPTFYHRVTYRIRLAPMKNDYEYDDWQTNLLDQGTMEIDRTVGGTGKLVPIRRGGVVISSPILLDANGNAYPEDMDPEQMKPHYNRFRTRKKASFARLFNRGLQNSNLITPTPEQKEALKYWNIQPTI